jgi:hypothetical protein
MEVKTKQYGWYRITYKYWLILGGNWSEHENKSPEILATSEEDAISRWKDSRNKSEAKKKRKSTLLSVKFLKKL